MKNKLIYILADLKESTFSENFYFWVDFKFKCGLIDLINIKQANILTIKREEKTHCSYVNYLFLSVYFNIYMKNIQQVYFIETYLKATLAIV